MWSVLTCLKLLCLLPSFLPSLHSAALGLFLLPTVSLAQIVYNPEDIKKVISRNSPKTVMLYRFVQPWLGRKSILTLVCVFVCLCLCLSVCLCLWHCVL